MKKPKFAGQDLPAAALVALVPGMEVLRNLMAQRSDAFLAEMDKAIAQMKGAAGRGSGRFGPTPKKQNRHVISAAGRAAIAAAQVRRWAKKKKEDKAAAKKSKGGRAMATATGGAAE